MSLPAKVRSIKAAEPDLYHGVPVLNLRVGDPIPTPRAPERYAVRVYPDLARYLLSANHDANRKVKPRTVTSYVRVMRAGLWWFTPESIVFSQSGTLENGQHRLVAVSEYGSDVWMMFDFGWPDEIINAIDRGEKRTTADAFAVERVPYGSRVAAAMSLISKYEQVLAQGGTRSFASLPVPTAQEAVAAYRDDPDGWDAASKAGDRVYTALDHGFGVGVWSAAFRIIAAVHPAKAVEFFEAVATGNEAAGSPSRVLADWARRRPVTATRTGDAREPLEVIVRAFNAWRLGKPTSFPKAAGFTMSRVK